MFLAKQMNLILNKTKFDRSMSVPTHNMLQQLNHCFERHEATYLFVTNSDLEKTKLSVL